MEKRLSLTELLEDVARALDRHVGLKATRNKIQSGQSFSSLNLPDPPIADRRKLGTASVSVGARALARTWPALMRLHAAESDDWYCDSSTT